jgi:hypothetical protein
MEAAMATSDANLPDEDLAKAAAQRAGQVKGAVADALSGLDQALMKSAQAAQLALQELAAKSREFSDSELKQAIHQMKKLESDLIAAAGRVAESLREDNKPKK